MAEFTVNITELPLGVEFGHFDGSIVGIYSVKPGSIANKLGLLCGDVLISINNKSVLDIESDEVLDLFAIQKLPFTATFERFNSISPFSDTDEDKIDGLEIEADDDNAFMIYCNSNSTSKSNQYAKQYDDNTDFESSGGETDYIEGSECSLSLQFSPGFSPSNYENTESTKIFKPFYQIDADNEFSMLPVTRTNMMLSVSDALLLPPPIGINTKYSENADGFIFNELSSNLSPDLDTKYVVSGYLRRICDLNLKYEELHFLIVAYLYNNAVMFDQRVTTKNEFSDDNDQIMMVSKNGFNYGVHEWSIKILKCDVYRQEIGVVSNIDYNDKYSNDILLEPGGLKMNNELGARAFYGNDLSQGINYYASYNDDGIIRCDKDLSNMKLHKIGWCTGDIIKVKLDLKKNNIRFFLNGVKVRKVLSLERKKIWYPVITFSGNCEYELMHYE